MMRSKKAAIGAGALAVLAAGAGAANEPTQPAEPVPVMSSDRPLTVQTIPPMPTSVFVPATAIPVVDQSVPAEAGTIESEGAGDDEPASVAVTAPAVVPEPVNVDPMPASETAVVTDGTGTDEPLVVDPIATDEPVYVEPTDEPLRVSFANCTEAKEAGYCDIQSGDPAYADHLDGDNDGTACEC